MSTSMKTPASILLVDDSPHNLATLTQMLSAEGYHLRQAINGEVALTAARTAAPDLILLDIRMPGQDGYEVCRQLQAEETTRTIPILFLSVLDAPEDKIKAFEAGGVDYITKPFQAEEVLARVRTHLAMRQLQQELQTANRTLEERVLQQTDSLRQVNAQLTQEIEERKRAEAEVRMLNQELELRVRDRTAQLAAINKELQDFAYIVSHDLKAPLRGIAHLAAWLSADYPDRLDTRGQEMCDLLRDRVARLNGMIDGILQYSRAGRETGMETTINLNLLLQDVLAVLAPPAHIRITVPPDLPTLIGDTTRLAQVFQNLLGNAISFIDKPQGEIVVSWADAGDVWQFRVADNGPGIAPQYHEKIFQIFQTFRPGDNQKNTGIGLTIVKKIVELYGGKIWVESVVGQGSTFVFTLSKHPDFQRSV